MELLHIGKAPETSGREARTNQEINWPQNTGSSTSETRTEDEVGGACASEREASCNAESVGLVTKSGKNWTRNPCKPLLF